MSDKPEASPWTIKSMPVAVRQKALKAANAADQTMAEWLVDAVNLLADRQANNQILPPDAGKPAVKPEMPEFDLQGFAMAISAASAAMLAAGGKPPLSLGRDAIATIRHVSRSVRGLQPRLTKRQTDPSNGTTTIEG